MKQKPFLRTSFCLLLAFVSLSLCSCHQGEPEKYRDDIEDYVKYRISVTNSLTSALCQAYSNTTSTEEKKKKLLNTIYSQYDTFDDLILARSNEGGQDFGTLLLGETQDDSSKYSMLALDILMAYKKTDIDLSSFRQVSSSPSQTVWKFTEKNTGLGFSFWLKKEDHWRLMCEEESLNTYITQKLEVPQPVADLLLQ